MHLNSRNELATEKITWTITNFSRLPQNIGIPFKSFIIHKKHARKVWRLFLYPWGRYDYDYVAAYFCKAYRIFDPAIYNCSMSVGDSEGKPIKSFEKYPVIFADSCIGRDKFIRRDTVEALREGSVTIQCKITECKINSFPSIYDDFERLSSDLFALYNLPVFSDLTVYIQHAHFFLHKCVLYARARHLSHLFGYQSFDQMPNVVQINNMDPDTFHILMIFLYTSKLEDRNFSLDLFRYADKYKISSVKQLTYEKVQEYQTYTKVSTQTFTITWNLKEIQFQKKGSVPFVQLFRTKCCMSQMVVRMGISEQCDGEKYIDISFKIFPYISHKVSLLCVMTLFSNSKAIAHKKASYNMIPEEKWHFPSFVKISDIPGDYGPCLYLTAEVSLSDGCSAYNNLHTTSRLFTQKETVVYPERLGSDLGRLLSPKVPSRFNHHDIHLKSTDNYSIPAHKAILYFRFPEIREYLMCYTINESHLSLNLCKTEIEAMLERMYKGSSTIIQRQLKA